MGIEGQVAGLLAVPLEEPGEGLPRVHYLQESGVVDQLLVPVGVGGGSGDQLIRHPPELVQKGLIGFAAKAAQHRRLVQAAGGECPGVHIPVPHPLIVGEENLRPAGVRLRHGAYIGQPVQPQQLGAVPGKLLVHPQRQDNEGLSSFPADHLPAEFQLLHRLAQAKALKEGTPSSLDRPLDRFPLVGQKGGMEVAVLQGKAAFRRGHRFAP